MKIYLAFNPDYNTVREVKDAAQVLRDLLNKRNNLGSTNTDAEMFLDIFDSMTQNFEVK